MRKGDLAVTVLEYVALCSLQDTQSAPLRVSESGGMGAVFDSVAACFDANEAHAFLFKEGVEDADGVTASANTGYDDVR